mgnify:CR=1 FL=1
MNSCVLLFCQWGNTVGQNLYSANDDIYWKCETEKNKTLSAIHPNTQINQIFNDFTVTRHKPFQN